MPMILLAGLAAFQISLEPSLAKPCVSSARNQAAQQQQMQGYQQEVEISFQEAYEGTTRQLQTNGRKLQVRIPAGVKTGSKVRVAGAGPEGLDLYLIVNITDERSVRTRWPGPVHDIHIKCVYFNPGRRYGCGNAHWQSQVEHSRRHTDRSGLSFGWARDAAFEKPKHKGRPVREIESTSSQIPVVQTKGVA